MVKAFAALGWKSENFTKGGISALIPQKRKDDCGYGKVDIFLSGDGCMVTYTLANPPTLLAGTLAKKMAFLNMLYFDSGVLRTGRILVVELMDTERQCLLLDVHSFIKACSLRDDSFIKV